MDSISLITRIAHPMNTTGHFIVVPIDITQDEDLYKQTLIKYQKVTQVTCTAFAIDRPHTIEIASLQSIPMWRILH